ncbi:MAG: multiprotein-bridging factor 1 family protein [Acidimicrobiia bacterium]
MAVRPGADLPPGPSTAPSAGRVGLRRAAVVLRAARLRAGLSQAELARRSGVPRTVVNAYERGQREPGADSVERLLAAAGIELGARVRPRVDLARNARILEQVLDLAEQLPTRRRGRLAFPPLGAPRRHAADAA